MKAEAQVLFLGSSLFTFTDTGPGGALPALVSRELSNLEPNVHWSCEGFLLFHSDDMFERVAAILDGKRPDVVVVDHSTFQFVHEAVLYRIRSRWPRLYPVAGRALQIFKRICGGTYEGAAGTRGRLFTLCRQIGLRVIGGDVEVTPETAVANATHLLDLLLALEDVAVISRDPMKSWFEPSSLRDRAERRLTLVTAQLRDYCRRRLVMRYDFAGELRRRGSAVVMHEDLIHYSLETRQEEARVVAPIVVAALQE